MQIHYTTYFLLFFVHCHSADVYSIISSGVTSLPSHPKSSNISDHNIFEHLNSVGKLKEQNEDKNESRTRENEDHSSHELMNAFLEKTAYGREGVLDSLFELNAKEVSTRITSNVSKLNSETGTAESNKGENTISELLQNLQFHPLVKGSQPITNVGLESDESLLKYIDSLKGEAWSHFKSIVLTYLNILEADDFRIKESVSIKLLMKALDIGDNINIINLFWKKVDPEIYAFVKGKFRPVSETVMALENSSVTGYNSTLLSLGNDLVNEVAWMTLRHIIDNLVKIRNNTVSQEEIKNYAEELSHTNPLAAKGLLFILNLPNRRPKYSENGQGRSLGYRMPQRSSKRDDYVDPYRDSYFEAKHAGRQDPYSLRRDGGYGHHDSGYDHHDNYGHGYKDYGYDHHETGYGHKDAGYGSGSYHNVHKGYYLDPYLILAGIGATALLAYLAYIILSTTPTSTTTRTLSSSMPRKRREAELENIIETAAFIHNSIEKGNDLYSSDLTEELDDLINSVNELWSTRSLNSCLKCSLFEMVKQRLLHPESPKLLFLSAFAQLIGMEKAGQLLDEIIHLHLLGKRARCEDGTCKLSVE